jgi:uncharacterized protein YigE (DUF2233 family)
MTVLLEYSDGEESVGSFGTVSAREGNHIMRGVLARLTILLLLAASISAATAAAPVSYRKVRMHGVYVHVVTVDMNASNVCVTPAIAKAGIGGLESFGSVISRLKPAVAITGTYFNIKSHVPVGDIVIDGRCVNTGFVGTAICITQDNKVDFMSLKRSRIPSWTFYPTAISAGPRLVTNGGVGVYPKSEGFNDGAIRKKARRAAIGVTKSNKLLMVVVNRPIYLRTLAQILKDLGAYQAMNLDGGSSTGLACNGRVIIRPARRLSNVILVYDSQQKFASIRQNLTPSLPATGKAAGKKRT